MKNLMFKPKPVWHVYILKCSDGTFYTGITTDLERRIEEHNTSPKSAKYTRGRRPVRLAYSCELENRTDALKEEYRIKQLSKQQKLDLTS